MTTSYELSAILRWITYEKELVEPKAAEFEESLEKFGLAHAIEQSGLHIERDYQFSVLNSILDRVGAGEDLAPVLGEFKEKLSNLLLGDHFSQLSTNSMANAVAGFQRKAASRLLKKITAYLEIIAKFE